MDKEVWEDIIGYENLYQVSNRGRIKSLTKKVKGSRGQTIIRKEIYRKLKTTPFGYSTIQLHKEGLTKMFFVHRLVAQAFIPNFNNKPFINHKNGVKTCNDVSNLEWVTSSENMRHAYANNLVTIPLLHCKAKLSVKQVQKIKELRGALSVKEISQLTNVPKWKIYAIYENKIYTKINCSGL